MSLFNHTNLMIYRQLRTFVLQGLSLHVSFFCFPYSLEFFPYLTYAYLNIANLSRRHSDVALFMIPNPSMLPPDKQEKEK